MKTRTLRIALLAAFAFAPAVFVAAGHGAFSSAQAATIADPARQLEDMARLFEAGDIVGLAKAAIPPAHYEELKVAWELHRLVPAPEREREEFSRHIGRVTAPDAVEQLMSEIEPKLAELRPQAPGAVLMGLGALQLAATSPESELTDEQRVALTAALPNIQAWASRTDFLSSDTMRDALTLLTDAARRTGIEDLEQLRALPLEGILEHASQVFVAGKHAVSLYGIDLDEVARTLQVETLKIDGQDARVRATITLFEVPVSADFDLVLVDGRWYGKQTLQHWRTGHDRQARVDH
jgi:hypothetical protein